MADGILRPSPRRSGAIITILTVLVLGAMANAIPRARLVPTVTGVERGCLVSEGRFSTMLAEIQSRSGYNYMAIDLTHAPLHGDAIWREPFDDVSRIYPVWGWVDVRAGVDQACTVAASLPLKGLFLYNAQPADVDAVHAAKRGLRVIPVVRDGETWGGTGAFAVAFAPKRFATEAAKTALPVLLAADLDEAGIATARAAATGDYLVCTIALTD